jgi:hypothetical protein
MKRVFNICTMNIKQLPFFVKSLCSHLGSNTILLSKNTVLLLYFQTFMRFSLLVFISLVLRLLKVPKEDNLWKLTHQWKQKKL